MGWEVRHGKQSYYYRPVRIDGQPRRVYLGAGAIGRMHALCDAVEKDTAAAAVARRLAWAVADRALLAAIRFARTVAAARLSLAGWYCHKGTWRPARYRPRTRQHRLLPDVPFAPLDARLRVLAVRVQAGDEDARRRLAGELFDGTEVNKTAVELAVDLDTAVVGLGVALHDPTAVVDDPACGLADRTLAAADGLLTRTGNGRDNARIVAARVVRTQRQWGDAARCRGLVELAANAETDEGPLAVSSPACLDRVANPETGL